MADRIDVGENFKDTKPSQNR